MKIGGFSFVEMLIVVMIVSVLAFLALPSTRPGEISRLEQASNEVVQAIRYARSEAMRSGEPHGIYVDATLQRLRVYHLDVSVTPPVPQFTVRNPMDKKFYDLRFDSDPVVSAATIDVVAIAYTDLGPSSLLSFTAQGTPFFTDGIRPYMLSNGNIGLSLGDHYRVISVTPYSGRVSVQ